MREQRHCPPGPRQLVDAPIRCTAFPSISTGDPRLPPFKECSREGTRDRRRAGAWPRRRPQQPQGVLFEIATTSPGFAVDEDAAHLGEALRLPKQHERLRSHLERILTPLNNPRAAARNEAWR
jgi:hypothetical protein